MKLQPDHINVPAIASYGPGWVMLKNPNGSSEKLTHSFALCSRAGKFEWNCPKFDALGAEYFTQLAEKEPELVIFGSGDKLRFPPPALLRSLVDKQIGLETMGTEAACRTYNILAGEGRHVVVALLIEA